MKNRLPFLRFLIIVSAGIFSTCANALIISTNTSASNGTARAGTSFNTVFGFPPPSTLTANYFDGSNSTSTFSSNGFDGSLVTGAVFRVDFSHFDVAPLPNTGATGTIRFSIDSDTPYLILGGYTATTSVSQTFSLSPGVSLTPTIPSGPSLFAESFNQNFVGSTFFEPGGGGSTGSTAGLLSANAGQVYDFSYSFIMSGVTDNVTASGFLEFRLGDTAVVPLPASLWLMLSGLIGIMSLARCKKNRGW